MKFTLIIAAMAALLVIAMPATAGAVPAPLQIGANGPVVKKLQRALHITVDGQFGSATQFAVMRLQARFGLITDGVVGPATRHALRNRNSMRLVLRSFDARTVAAAKKSGWAIELHLNGNSGSTRILHYRNGRWSLPVASPSSSAGWNYDQYGRLKFYTTCTGIHYLGRADSLGRNAYSTVYHHAPMAWARYWCGGIAFHQDPLNASHGCVHLPSYADAEFIWRMPSGTQVLSIEQR